MNKLINTSKRNFLFLIGLSLIFLSCSNDDDAINGGNPNPTSKTPKYNNGIFFTTANYTSINSKINFLNLEDNSVREIYSSTTNNTVSIDGDKTYYYLTNQKIDNLGNHSILVKDVETFNDVTTIINNLSYPQKVVSYSSKLFIINADNPNSFETKPFISIFTKNKDFTFEQKINLPEKTVIRGTYVFNNKLYLILAPKHTFSFKQSVLVFNLQNEQIEANLTFAHHDRPSISDMVFFENELYVSISPTAGGFLTESGREVYQLSGTTFNLVNKITDLKFGVSSVISTYQSDFYTTSDTSIYKRMSSNTNLELVYNNDLAIEFLYFLNSTDFLVISANSKLILKKLNDASASTEIIDFTFERTLQSTTLFKL